MSIISSSASGAANLVSITSGTERERGFVGIGTCWRVFEEQINHDFTTRTIRYLIALTDAMSGSIDGIFSPSSFSVICLSIYSIGNTLSGSSFMLVPSFIPSLLSSNNSPKQKGVPSFLREYIDTYIITTGNSYNLQVWNRNPNSASVQVD